MFDLNQRILCLKLQIILIFYIGMPDIYIIMCIFANDFIMYEIYFGKACAMKDMWNERRSVRL